MRGFEGFGSPPNDAHPRSPRHAGDLPRNPEHHRACVCHAVLGVLLKRINWINDNFIHTASALVFNVTMPALLFLGILHADLHAALQPALLIYFSIATLAVFRHRLGLGDLQVPA